MVGLSVLILLGMAGITLGRQPLELADGCALVAGLAIQGRMRAHQRETVLVLVDLLDRNLPSLHCMALIAGGAELPLVDIRVAVRAFLTYIGKNWLGMALGAGHAFVHAAQWKTSLAMVEFRNGADRFPAAHGMAVLAGNAQRPMRTAGIGIGFGLRGHDARSQQEC